LRWAFSKRNIVLSFLLLLYSAFLGMLDLLTKAWAYSSLNLHEPKNILGEFLRFTLVINYNTAFGLSLGKDFPYVAASTALAVLLFWVMFFERRRIYKFLYATILGGAIGNIVDRLLRGGVVDFVDLGVGQFRWYTFNLADVWVTLGLAGLAVMFVVEEMKNSRSKGADSVVE